VPPGMPEGHRAGPTVMPGGPHRAPMRESRREYSLCISSERRRAEPSRSRALFLLLSPGCERLVGRAADARCGRAAGVPSPRLRAPALGRGATASAGSGSPGGGGRDVTPMEVTLRPLRVRAAPSPRGRVALRAPGQLSTPRMASAVMLLANRLAAPAGWPGAGSNASAQRCPSAPPSATPSGWSPPPRTAVRVGTGWEQEATSRGPSWPLVSSSADPPMQGFPGGNRRPRPIEVLAPKE
jgi:hypothetical protein